jgi:demethylmenaquinone methyltransferase/2-methoxy-6-polyprenyl-1,4-benzoquinol methylase
VLELACGTGLWTRHLVRLASSVVAVDGSPEALALCRERVAGPIDLVRADLFSWDPPVAAFDTCVFAFWLSHVPSEHFETFWSLVARALRPGGTAIVIDSLETARSTAADHALPGAGEDTMIRRLDDGREFRIVKRFYSPDALLDGVRPLGWDGAAEATGEFFVFARFQLHR